MFNARAVLPFRILLPLASSVLWPAPAAAQYSEPPPPAAYALQGVTLVRADGSRTDSLTIVVRRGFIEAMGPNVEIPADAEVLEGDSLMVYPGIIDAQGEAEFEFPESNVGRGEVASWAPPREVQGFTPHRRVVDHLTATGSDLESQRANGVVAAGVHPAGPIMPGRGAVLLFRKGAELPSGLVVRPALGPVMSFRGASNVYPSTVLGAVAFLRQAFEDARHDSLELAAHARDPRGLKAPQWDPDYEVLRAAMAGRNPVFFTADRAEEIRQVLALAREYGFHPVIVGGDEAWKVAHLLAEQQVPVLVALDFPKPKRWKPEQRSEQENQAVDTASAEQGEVQQPRDAAAEREKRDLENLYRNASRLAGAGVAFALTSGGGKADIREGVRKAVEYGLSEAKALAAVTSTPAALLGVPYLSRVDVGMPATFVVSDGPLFAEDTEIRYTFVEGELEKGKPKTTGAGEAPTVDVTGVWEVESAFGGQSYQSRLTLVQQGASLTGTMVSDLGRRTIEDGSVSGNRVSWIIRIDYGGQPIEISYTGTVEGDSMSGTSEMAMGSGTWQGRRVPGLGARR